MILRHSRVARSRILGVQLRFLLFAVALTFATCFVFLTRSPEFRIVPYIRDNGRPSIFDLFGSNGDLQQNADIAVSYWELKASDISDWRDPDDREDPNDVEPGYSKDGKGRGADEISRLQEEKDKRKIWRYIYSATAKLKSSNQIYGKTVATLTFKENRTDDLAQKLVTKPDRNYKVNYSKDKPVHFDPYPSYNSAEWQSKGHAPYVACDGANGKPVDDIMVFKGRPRNFPNPLMGSYHALNLDPNICWERDTRLGPYGLLAQTKEVNGHTQPLNWDQVDWGTLQERCLKLNAKRYDNNANSSNPYLVIYPETQKFIHTHSNSDKVQGVITADARKRESPGVKVSLDQPGDSGMSVTTTSRSTNQYQNEDRTALLLRSYTGKNYTESEKQNIRALISELSLRSGGEYEVFLLVQVKDDDRDIFGSRQNYLDILNENIPIEFHGITVLWNDAIIKGIYTEMKEDSERSVHTAQWLSVQKFSHDHPQFEYIWNWEMDFRYTGHHYDLLDNIQKFARKQPRKGLWERNERYYIPEYHGDYDTTFRESIERQYGESIVWGPPDLPFIKPQGPKPPSSPSDDNYEWGVGEAADVITVGPMFNPIDSLWIIGEHIWGYVDENHRKETLPRRTTIITHSRVSKRLLNLMHVENMRGNHVASEMTPQTVALHHGLKAVFAPHPIYMDRNWTGAFVNKWFNAGPDGAAGGDGSAMGWCRERRYQGSTWYYRAEPPNRLFNNWMGWEDTGIGGSGWERSNGRPCLPSIMLHPIKDSEPTEKDHKTGFYIANG